MDWWQYVFGRVFDIGRDCPVLGLAMLVAWFGTLFIIGVVTGGQLVKNRAVDLLVPQLILLPVITALTLWCYRHPEQLENRPDAWMFDLRLLWPFALAFDVLLFLWASKRR